MDFQSIVVYLFMDIALYKKVIQISTKFLEVRCFREGIAEVCLKKYIKVNFFSFCVTFF